MKCCDSLYESYKFMLKVRDAEKKLKTEGPPPPRKKLKTETQEQQAINEIPSIPDIQDDLIAENILGDDILESEYSEEDIVNNEAEEETKCQAVTPEKKSEPSRKRQKQVSSTDISDIIVVTDYHFAYKNENSQVIANIVVDNNTINNSGDGNYSFDRWLDNPEEASIYSCTFCVKGFATSDFLLKHITSCHICLTCFKMCETNKHLNQHMKTHSEEKLVCPFCGKLCTYNVFRQHIRKQHVLNLPYYIGILPQNLVTASYE